MESPLADLTLHAAETGVYKYELRVVRNYQLAKPGSSAANMPKGPNRMSAYIDATIARFFEEAELSSTATGPIRSLRK
jgi:hypothetical protein